MKSTSGDFADSKKGDQDGDNHPNSIKGEHNEFGHACFSKADQLTRKGAHTFLCCIDGSDQSDCAFNSTMNLRGKFDHLCVFHAFRGDKPDIMPPTWRPKQLESKYEIELIGNIPSRLYSMCWKDRKGDKVLEVLKTVAGTTHTDASELVNPPDFVVMGHHGRKGPKAERTTLGSTTDQALRTLPYPCLVVKELIPKGRRRYCMAVNGTKVSKMGLDILLQLVNPKDSLTLMYFVPKDSLSSPDHLVVQSYYERELEEYGPVDTKFMLIERNKSVPVTHAIVEFVNDSEFDILAIAPRAKQDRSSVTDHIVNNVYCSVLLCKN